MSASPFAVPAVCYTQPVPRPTSAKTDPSLRAAAQAAREAPASVAALVLDVLSRQAEGRLLFAGKEHVAKKAETHGVTAAEVGGEDVLLLLERGPETERQRALIAALMVEGLRGHLDDPKRLERFARHADWLELSTDYAPYAAIDPVLEDDAGPVWRAVGVVPAATGSEAAAAARRTLRQVAFRHSVHPVAAEVRGDAPSAARGVGDDEGADAAAVEGRLMRLPPTGFRGLLRLVSGFAVLEWVVRGILFALGLRRPAKLRVVEGGLRLKKRVVLLGRVIRETDETYTDRAVASVGRTHRWPALPLVAGALAFAGGVVIGGVWLFEGMRSGETVLLLAAAAAIFIGGGLDLGLSILLPARKKQVAVELAVLPKRRFQLVAVPEARAEAFVAALRDRVTR